MSLISSIYRSRVRVKPINRQALYVTLSPSDHYVKRRKKRRKSLGECTCLKRKEKKKLPKTKFIRFVKNVLNYDKEKLSALAINKINYVSERLNRSARCILRLRIDGKWYCVDALIDAGVLKKGKWKVFAGRLTRADSIAGVVLLSREFGLAVSETLMKQYELAQNGFFGTSKFFGITNKQKGVVK